MCICPSQFSANFNSKNHPIESLGRASIFVPPKTFLKKILSLPVPKSFSSANGGHGLQGIPELFGQATAFSMLKAKKKAEKAEKQLRRIKEKTAGWCLRDEVKEFVFRGYSTF